MSQDNPTPDAPQSSSSCGCGSGGCGSGGGSNAIKVIIILVCLGAAGYFGYTNMQKPVTPSDSIYSVMPGQDPVKNAVYAVPQDEKPAAEEAKAPEAATQAP